MRSLTGQEIAIVLVAVTMCMSGCNPWFVTNLLDKHSSYDAEVESFAGAFGVTGSSDGGGTTALFYYPELLCSDGTSLFVLDSGPGGDLIRKVDISTRAVTTIGGPGTFGGLCTDGVSIYYCDKAGFAIQALEISTGTLTTIAGGSGSGNSDGIGSSAKFQTPFDVCCDGEFLYITDPGNNNIRKLEVSTGSVTTLAGSTTGASGESDGFGTAATFSEPFGCCLVGSSLYVSEHAKGTVVRIVSTAVGNVTTATTPSWGEYGIGEYPVSASGEFIYRGLGKNTSSTNFEKFDPSSWERVSVSLPQGFYSTAVCPVGEEVFMTDGINSVVLRITRINTHFPF
jgi:hypothetical protein